jgi:hypothetical protein
VPLPFRTMGARRRSRDRFRGASRADDLGDSRQGCSGEPMTLIMATRVRAAVGPAAASARRGSRRRSVRRRFADAISELGDDRVLHSDAAATAGRSQALHREQAGRSLAQRVVDELVRAGEVADPRDGLCGCRVLLGRVPPRARSLRPVEWTVRGVSVRPSGVPPPVGSVGDKPGDSAQGPCRYPAC